MAAKALCIICGLTLLSACTATPPSNTVTSATTPQTSMPSSGSQQSSYHLGLLQIASLRAKSNTLDSQAFEQGMRDALAGKTTSEIINPAEWHALAEVNLAVVKEANLEAGKTFLASNKSKPGIVTLPSGVQYQVLKEGKGDKPRLKDTIGILYTIRGIDDKVKVDNMIKGKAKMYEIVLKKMISKGWQEALLLMPQGSKWRLFIPGELAFGEKGLSEKSILPNETLVIDTNLLEVK